MKTMTAKYNGTCKACGCEILRGDLINFHGRGHAEHADCHGGARTAEEREAAEEAEEIAAGLEPGTLAADRRAARNGSRVTRFASGAVHYQNSRGRCEDAPCCGCCS